MTEETAVDEPMNERYGSTCVHGSLARACEVCDLLAEVERLRAERDGVEKVGIEWMRIALDAEAERDLLLAAIREHDRTYTLDGGGRARCHPVMGGLLTGDDDA